MAFIRRGATASALRNLEAGGNASGLFRERSRRVEVLTMNVLMVTAYPPVLHMHGGGVRMYHNIRILSRRHSVHLISFVGSDEEQEMLAPLRCMCETVTAIRRIPDFRPHWLSVLPFMVREFSTPAMHRAVDDAIRSKRIDVVQCEYLQM